MPSSGIGSQNKNTKKIKKIMRMVGTLGEKVAFYRLQCRPEAEAAKLAYEVMGEEA